MITSDLLAMTDGSLLVITEKSLLAMEERKLFVIHRNTPMEEIIKKFLGKAVLIVLFIFAIAYAGRVVSGIVYDIFNMKNYYPNRTIDVIGEGKVATAPDIARFSFSIITEGGKNLNDLQKENTEKNNKIIAFLKANGIEAKDIRTLGYNVELRYQQFTCPEPEKEARPCPPQEVVGYTIRQEVLVKVRDLNKVGDLLAGVITMGANSVSQLSFAVDDPVKFQNQARQEAIIKAKEKAQVIAGIGGFKLKELQRFYEDVPYAGGYESGYGSGSAMGGVGGGGMMPPTVEPGSQEITVRVTLTYEIE